MDIFHIFWRKHLLWLLIEEPGEALLMSTHKICFCGEIRQKQYFLLGWGGGGGGVGGGGGGGVSSGAMVYIYYSEPSLQRHHLFPDIAIKMNFLL